MNNRRKVSGSNVRKNSESKNLVESRQLERNLLNEISKEITNPKKDK